MITPKIRSEYQIIKRADCGFLMEMLGCNQIRSPHSDLNIPAIRPAVGAAGRTIKIPHDIKQCINRNATDVALIKIQ